MMAEGLANWFKYIQRERPMLIKVLLTACKVEKITVSQNRLFHVFAPKVGLLKKHNSPSEKTCKPAAINTVGLFMSPRISILNIDMVCLAKVYAILFYLREGKSSY